MTDTTLLVIPDLIPDTIVGSDLYRLNNALGYLRMDDKWFEDAVLKASSYRAYFACAIDEVVDSSQLEQMKDYLQLLEEKLQEASYHYYKAEQVLMGFYPDKLRVELLEEAFNCLLPIPGPGDLKAVFSQKEPVQALLDQLYQEQDKELLQQSWYLHFEIIRNTAFDYHSGKMARLAQYYYLCQNGLHMNGMWSLEQLVYDQKPQYFKIINQLFDKSPELTDWVGAYRFTDQLSKTMIREMVQEFKKEFRRAAGFQEMSLREKNAVNHFFEVGYLYKNQIQQLPAQQAEELRSKGWFTWQAGINTSQWLRIGDKGFLPLRTQSPGLLQQMQTLAL